MPLIVPAVAGSMEIVAAFGAAAGWSGPEGDLLHPSTSSPNKIVGTKERVEMVFIFSSGLTLRTIGEAGDTLPPPLIPISKGLTHFLPMCPHLAVMKTKSLFRSSPFPPHNFRKTRQPGKK